MKPHTLVAIALTAISSLSHAQVSTSTVTYQGRLTDAGQPIADGVYPMIFRIWNAATNGQLIEEITVPNVSVLSGLFTAPVPVSQTTFTGEDRWWSVEFESFELLPRQLVAQVPMAINAKTLDPGTETEPAVTGILRVSDSVISYRGASSGAALVDSTADEYIPSWRGSGIPAQLFRLAGASSQNSTGFGVVIGDQIASPVVWLYQPFDRNAFMVRSVQYQQGPFQPGSTAILTAGYNQGPRVGIGTDQPVSDLDVRGRTMTQTLQITGGSDLAEPCVIEPSHDGTRPLPGMVVSMNPSCPASGIVADQASDKKVLGVISGGNGLQAGLLLSDINQPNFSDGLPIAKTGKVYVLVDESFGKIEAGDRLTSSTTPGYAMRVPDDQPAYGCVIGKAWGPVDENGFVLMVVQLQ